ncbi:MAG TPA: hypothetical protein VIG30_02590 [Ktedonobacterales bacterium]
MGSSLADLDQRDVARVRAELAEVIAARFAYPAFFDYRAGAPRMRPLAATRRQEIARFVQLADLGAIEQMDLTAPQVRRMLERLLRRFLELGGEAASSEVRRRAALARVDVPAVAAEMQRGLVAFATGAPEVAGGYGLPRQRVSWHGTNPAASAPDPARAAQSARLIQAALLPRRDPTLGKPYGADETDEIESEPAAASVAPMPQPASAPAPWYIGDDSGDDALAARQSPTEPTPAAHPLGWRAAVARVPRDDPHEIWNDAPDVNAGVVAAVPIAPAAPTGSRDDAGAGNGVGNGHAATVAPTAWAAMLRDLNSPESTPSPFQGLGGGAQSGIFGPLPENPFGEPLTGPLAAVGNGNGHDMLASPGANGSHAAEDDGAMRGLPPALIQVYSEYLRALRPADLPPATPPVAPPDSTPITPPRHTLQAVPAPDAGAWERPTMPPAPPAPLASNGLRGHAAPIPATPGAAPAPAASAAASADAGNDRLIFAQLRNQLDAYLRVMALAAGIPAEAGEPERVVAALARAGRLSAGDERLAGQILAITGRVLAGGAASPDDYRQAFMLYLLFHRGQVGV